MLVAFFGIFFGDCCGSVVTLNVMWVNEDNLCEIRNEITVIIIEVTLLSYIPFLFLVLTLQIKLHPFS
jgi:hypothetical protein